MPPPIIELTAVDQDYRMPGAAPFRALHDISLRIAPGSWTAILGPSGSGKSTLLNVLAGLDRPSGGCVRIAGTDLGPLSENGLTRWRGAHVGVVFQFFQLLPTLTVAENLLLAMSFVGRIQPKARAQRAADLLSQVGIADQADKRPFRLSGGQQQRAAIARALANDPPILIADEPTGNLDSDSTRAVLAVLKRLRDRGVTVVVVTHDPAVAACADRIVRLVDGRLVDGRRTEAA